MATLTQDTRPQDTRPSRLTQDTRIAQLSTPLGKDVLVFVRFDCTEGLSELFEYRIEALSEQADLDFDKAIGQQCSVKVRLYGQEREFCGILVEAQWIGVKQDYYIYRLVLRPWFWLLSHTTDCRIWQDKKVPEIIKEVFQDRGFTDFESKLTDEGSYPKREYCVQYRETDLNFVCRLMEEEGIYYFFKHSGGKHTLVMADSKGSHQPVPGLAKIPYAPPGGEYNRKEQRIYEVTSERKFRTGKVALNDYDYEKPNANLMSDANASEKYTKSDMKVYDYPGKYTEKSVGERYAKFRLEAEQALDHRRHCNGDAISLFPGGLTTLERHPSDAQNIEYLVARASHSLVAELYRSGSGSGADPSEEIYYGHYEFQPSSRPYRTPCHTPKPLIHGIQTAKVVTKDDGGSEEIDVEKLTEIYVRFYWDHRKKRSCKLRCAQVWSGKKWGGQYIPRVGMEAVIEFLEGDPDRPLVVGTVYNDEYKPPYELPSKKNIAGIYSDSTKGGGGYNEFCFDDSKMSEKIRMHAEKDHEVVIRHAETTEIGEIFEIPKGSPSRETTLKLGDDKLTISTGDQNVSIPLGSQKTDATIQIMDSVIASSITITPASISIFAPEIDLTAATINITAPIINITGVVNLVGVLNITGGITVNTMVPVLIPA
jgi:type VI secretion system secreted protein VgrG